MSPRWLRSLVTLPLRLLLPLFYATACCRAKLSADFDRGKAASYALSYVDGWQFLDLLPSPRSLNCLWMLRRISIARRELSDWRDEAGFGTGALGNLARRVENALPGALLLDVVVFYLLFRG